MAHPYWPLADLRVRTPLVELRPAWSEEDVIAIAAVAAQGIHEPDFMPFLRPWTDAPSPQLERSAVQNFMARWGRWASGNWSIPFAVVVDGEPAGIQDVNAIDFPIRRTVSTGSWLGRRFQGRGVGKEMRAAALHFAFAGLGAQRAETGAFEDNAPSLGVTRSLGYEPNGDEIIVRRGKPTVELRFKMSRATWEANRRDDITIDGLDRCLELFQLEDDQRNDTANSTS